MKIVSQPAKTLTIQLREFERPKQGGRMKLKASKTITLHNVSIEEIQPSILAVLKNIKPARS